LGPDGGILAPTALDNACRRSNWSMCIDLLVVRFGDDPSQRFALRSVVATISDEASNGQG
jgi:hypothetical protein